MPPIRTLIRFQAYKNKPPNLNVSKLRAGAVALERVWANNIISLLRKYPPQLSTKYVRTNKLGASWEIIGPRVIGEAVVVYIVNTVTDKRGRHYMPYVQGEWQVPINEGRWLRIDDPSVLKPADFHNHLKRLVLSCIGSPKP